MEDGKQIREEGPVQTNQGPVQDIDRGTGRNAQNCRGREIPNGGHIFAQEGPED